MVGPEGIDRVDQCQGPLDVRHVRGQFGTLDRHRIGAGPVADRLGRSLRALGQHVPEALASQSLLQHGDHRLAVAPAQLDAVGVVCGDEPPLEALDGESHRRPGGNGVHPRLVAELVGVGDGVEVGDPAVGAEHRGGLVLGTARLRIDGLALPL